MIISSKCMFFDFEHLNNNSHQTHRPFFFDFPTILKVIPLFYFLKYCKVKKINALFASNFGRIADPSFGLTRRDWYASRGRQVFQLAEEEDQKECRWWRRRRRRRRWRPLQRRHGQPSPPQREGITTKVSSSSSYHMISIFENNPMCLPNNLILKFSACVELFSSEHGPQIEILCFVSLMGL